MLNFFIPFIGAACGCFSALFALGIIAAIQTAVANKAQADMQARLAQAFSDRLNPPTPGDPNAN